MLFLSLLLHKETQQMSGEDRDNLGNTFILYNMHSDLYRDVMIFVKREEQGHFHRSADVDFPTSSAILRIC